MVKKPKYFYVPGLPPISIPSLTITKPIIPTKPKQIGVFTPPISAPGGVIYVPLVDRTAKLKTDYRIQVEILIGIAERLGMAAEVIAQLPLDRFWTQDLKLGTEPFYVPPQILIETLLDPAYNYNVGADIVETLDITWEYGFQ